MYAMVALNDRPHLSETKLSTGESRSRSTSKSKHRIVIIEDDPDISRLIEYQLQRESGYKTECCLTGEEGLAACSDATDLVILDLNLPGLDGLEVCRELRSRDETASVPILMLTARVSEQDRIRGLDIGADDYVTKPFSVKELVARVRALLRRASRQEEPALYEHDGLKVDLENMHVAVDGTPVPLTRKEWGLLKFLIENRGRVLSREKILERVWGEDFFGVDRTVDVHIRHLRKKLGGAADPIETLIGVGYRWREAES